MIFNLQITNYNTNAKTRPTPQNQVTKTQKNVSLHLYQHFIVSFIKI